MKPSYRPMTTISLSEMVVMGRYVQYEHLEDGQKVNTLENELACTRVIRWCNK